MRLAALLSGENPDLSKAEFIANLERQGVKTRVVGMQNRLLFVDAETRENMNLSFEGLALTHEACELLGALEDAEKFSWKKRFGRASVRAVKLPPGLDKSKTEAEKKVGSAFWKQGVKVDQSASETIRIYLTPKKDLLCRLIWKNTEDFEGRRSHLRPFSAPIAMHPKFARAMTNLARVKKGQKVLDPFCGTGGVLIEAGLVGAKVFGVDIQPKIVAGCKRNLEHFGIPSASVKAGDALKAKGKFDAVVTELPFGKSTRLTMEKKKLYSSFLKRLPQLLKRGSCAVISSDRPLPNSKGLSKKGTYPVYVHRQMTRYINVYRRV